MRGTCHTIAIFGAMVLGTAFVSNATAQCGLSPVHHAAPASWRPLAPSPGEPRLMPASFVPGFATIGDAEDEPIVGMWHVTFTAEGNAGGPPDNTPIDNALVVWHSDNTEIMNSGRPPQDGDFCMGVWEKVGKSRYRLNHFAWGGNDTANAPSGIGNAAGPTRFTEEVVVSADGNHYGGWFTLDAYDTSGTVTTHIIGVIAGTRITVNTTVSDLL
jgi:hypothetical protein